MHHAESCIAQEWHSLATLTQTSSLSTVKLHNLYTLTLIRLIQSLNYMGVCKQWTGLLDWTTGLNFDLKPDYKLGAFFVCDSQSVRRNW